MVASLALTRGRPAALLCRVQTGIPGDDLGESFTDANWRRAQAPVRANLAAWVDPPVGQARLIRLPLDPTPVVWFVFASA